MRHVALCLALGVLFAVGCSVNYIEPSAPADASNYGANDPRGIWLAIQPSQCSQSDAWRQDWFATRDGDANYPFGEREVPLILEYCSKHGVTVLDSITQHDRRTRCAACTCPAGYIVFVLVSEADAGTVASFGGRAQRPY